MLTYSCLPFQPQHYQLSLMCSSFINFSKIFIPPLVQEKRFSLVLNKILTQRNTKYVIICSNDMIMSFQQYNNLLKCKHMPIGKNQPLKV